MQRSWEEANRQEQNRFALQLRWAQNERGVWEAVTWGNPAKRPENNAPLPVRQLMRNTATEVWEWVPIGNVAALNVDWQRGPFRIEPFKVRWVGDAEPTLYDRPCGDMRHQDAPAPQRPKGEHGTSGERSFDDYARQSRPGSRSAPVGDNAQGGGSQAGRDALAAALRNRKRT